MGFLFVGRWVDLFNKYAKTFCTLLQWNGINNSGQSVSAGLYFYTIQAGDPWARSGYSFRDGRKMVLLK